MSRKKFSRILFGVVFFAQMFAVFAIRVMDNFNWLGTMVGLIAMACGIACSLRLEDAYRERCKEAEGKQ